MFPFQHWGHARINKLRETVRSLKGDAAVSPHVRPVPSRALSPRPVGSARLGSAHARRASPTCEPGDFEAHSGRSGENKSCDAMVPLWKWHVLKFNLPFPPFEPTP